MRGDVRRYHDFLMNYLGQNPQDLIIPLFNDTAEFASKYKTEIEATGCKVEIPSWDVFIRGHNKESLMEICRDLRIPPPHTEELRQPAPFR